MNKEKYLPMVCPKCQGEAWIYGDETNNELICEKCGQVVASCLCDKPNRSIP